MVAGIRFIDGEPMKPATKVLAGSSYTSRGVPNCCSTPPRITAICEASVIASIWS